MVDRVQGLDPGRQGGWKLRGYDTFAGEWYALPGQYSSEEAAAQAARRRLDRLEREQPTTSSGGQAGIQDRVYIVRPDGTMCRYLPEASIDRPSGA